ncbi:MAG TPA: peptidyl-alpha-hydroxyglycine alpha-amidating lyase family protein [Dehalococcoidia bacterium]|nr:peptidyl-alpha-hydroxyglycine alpha-amidating lyase family protein [Dehalococcoidia bacterium]
MATVGSGRYTYDVIDRWGQLPPGQSFGRVSDVAVDSQDRVYVFQRHETPVLIFDRDGKFLDSWGEGQIEDPHGIYIQNDLVYLTDRDEHTARVFTLDGDPLLTLGNPGQPSNTGATKDGELVPHAAGPFNKPTKLAPAPSGDLYVSDGYRNARVHRFAQDGQLLSSWGAPGKTAPGEFHLPHSIWVGPDGRVYVCDRENSRIQIFSPEGEFLTQWTDVHRPTDLYFDAEGTAYVTELLPRVSVLDPEGKAIARWESLGFHGLIGDSRGDLYLASVGERLVTKCVRRG